MTSNSRTARCGPACRVVWQGRSLKLPPMPIPVFAERLSAEAKARFLPDSEYARAKPVNLKKLAAAQAKIVERYKNEVR